MITLEQPFHRNFAAGICMNPNACRMAKTKYQERATDYAHEYLERLLKMEDTWGKGPDSSKNEQAAKRHSEERTGKSNNNK